MKKFTLIIAAVVMDFAFASCSGPSKEAILNEVSAFFTKAQTDIQAIDNADALVEFVKSFGDKKDEFMKTLSEKFEVKDDQFVGFSQEENAEIMGKINDMATEYNKVEYAKCGEIMKPYIDKFDGIVNGLYEKFQGGEEITEDMTNELKGTYEEITKYADIIPEELANVFYADDAKIAEIFNINSEE